MYSFTGKKKRPGAHGIGTKSNAIGIGRSQVQRASIRNILRGPSVPDEQDVADENEQNIQGIDLAEEMDVHLQEKSRTGTVPAVPDKLESQLHSLQGKGRPLPAASRSFYESRFGRDFSDVNVHDDTGANKLAGHLQAKAFTFGKDVVFGAGEYRPDTGEGRRLMAHELTHIVQQGARMGEPEGNGVLQRVATDPVVPVRTQLALGAGVGRSRPNNVADVRLIQDRLLELRFLSAADHAAEQPAAGATGTVPEANLAATIAAIEAFQTQVLGHSTPDGAVDAGGNTLRALNSAVPQPTAAEMTAVSTARAGITETVTRGVTLSAAVGKQPNASVIAGAVNRPADVTAVQTRLTQLGHLSSTHGESPAGVAVVAAIVITAGVGRGRPNQATDVRQVQARLLALGHLSVADHAAESPAAVVIGAIPEANLAATITAIEAFQDASGFSSPDGAVDVGGTTLGFLNTDSVPSAALTQTKNAIHNFQANEVRYWKSRGEVSGAITDRVVAPGDATAALLDRVSSYREQFPSGEDIHFRDFPRSNYTVNTGGASYRGTAAPSALPVAEYTAVGLDPTQTAALRYVSSHEGNFDALNTYDIARVSFGFIQFAGGRGLPPFMALLKSRNPAAFATMFQTYGIDVEFNVVGGNIEHAALVVLDPATGTVVRDTAAEAMIRDSQRLSAVFIRAGRSIDVQRVQIEAATRDYALPALASTASFNADIIDVLAAPGGAVVATHAGAAARAFRATPAFATLNAAGRIVQRHATTTASMGTLLGSEQGVAVLLDRAIQEGAGSGAARLRAAMRWVADQAGLTDIAAANEADVLQQVVDDLTADIAIAESLARARGHLNTLRTAASATGATVALIIARAQAASARAEVDSAIAQLPNKSLDTVRSSLEVSLPAQRLRLNFTPAPANIAAIRALLLSIRNALNPRKPNAVNSRAFRARVQDILGSTLAAPP